MKSNDRYHLPILANLDVSYISFSRLTVMFSLFHYGITCYNDQIGYYKMIFQLFVIINICSVILSFMKKIYYKFQVATFILNGINFLILFLDLDIFGLYMFTNANINYNNAYSWYALLYIIVMLVAIIVSSAYYVYCYKIKKECVFGCRVGAEKKESSVNNGIIFGLSLIAPFVLIGRIKNLFGVLLGLLFSLTLPSNMVDSFYAAYFIHKYPECKEKI